MPHIMDAIELFQVTKENYSLCCSKNQLCKSSSFLLHVKVYKVTLPFVLGNVS